MAKNIMRDLETSSVINKRVREDETLIEEAHEVDFVTYKNNIYVTISESV